MGNRQLQSVTGLECLVLRGTERHLLEDLVRLVSLNLHRARRSRLGCEAPPHQRTMQTPDIQIADGYVGFRVISQVNVQRQLNLLRGKAG